MKSMSKCAIFAVLAFGILAVAGPGWAQQDDLAGNAVVAQAPSAVFTAGISAPETYGTSSYITKALPAFAFHGFHGGEYWMGSDGSIYHDTGHSYYETTFQLPNGAILYGVTPNYYDTRATNEFRMWVWRYSIPGNAAGTQTELFTHASGTTAVPGWSGTYRNFTAAETIKDFDVPADATIYYHVRISLSNADGDQSVRFAGMSLWYKLQVSPAPGVATFPNDVPTTHPYFRFVEALAKAGITGGCGTGLYCPDSPVTRGQMAVFLSVALGLHWPSI